MFTFLVLINKICHDDKVFKHTHAHTPIHRRSLLSQAIQYKDTQSSGNNLILVRDVIGFDRQG